jgi:N-acetyl-anhydromuramyl-L-alanine amidase AmpD
MMKRMFISKPVSEATAKKELVKEQKVLKKLNLKEIITVDFPTDQYFREAQPKNQVFIHHTVSGQGVNGDIAWWRSTADHVATAIIVGWDGKIYQLYGSKFWGYHLGLRTANNKQLNKESIGIEIDAWGGLVRTNRQWYPAKWDKELKKNVANTKVAPIQNVQVYPDGFRGFYGFEKYTDAQIEAVRELLVFWNGRYKIPLDYKEDMWDISDKALAGEDGVWTHVSYREDKSDCHPQPELIKMLKSV